MVMVMIHQKSSSGLIAYETTMYLWNLLKKLNIMMFGFN